MPGQGTGENPTVFVLKRELSEVHLLLDNISSSPDNRLPLAGAEATASLGEDWLRKVCEIDWPPTPETNKAAEANLLITVKDYLNERARPASGATIAFTLLVTQGGSWGRPEHGVADRGDGVPSRRSLASVAYPDLIGKARYFRIGMGILVGFLALWLALTCTVSGYVAYGNAALQQLTLAQTRRDQAVQRVEETEAPVKSDQSATQKAPLAVQSKLVVLPADILCSQATQALQKYQASPPGGIAPPFSSLSQMQACSDFNASNQAFQAASRQLLGWLHPFGNREQQSFATVNVATNVSIWGSSILPIFYGILGAGAAVVRALSLKIKMSLLTPRDLILSLQQLALGALTGACIGLFFAQPGAAAGSQGGGTLGPVALSASALSFIAGFGVDAVFVTIDSIIRRIFNLPPTPGASDTAKDASSTR